MQAGDALPWEVTCRGVVDGIALVLHVARRSGGRFVEDALEVCGYDAPTGHWITAPPGERPDTQRESRTHTHPPKEVKA
ncbi:MAG: hypothetical protein J4F34_08845 [Gemmatimonadetes bacterium]|nr:hypothetical protein [Gemmatimonadota bacterium]